MFTAAINSSTKRKRQTQNKRSRCARHFFFPMPRHSGRRNRMFHLPLSHRWLRLITRRKPSRQLLFCGPSSLFGLSMLTCWNDGRTLLGPRKPRETKEAIFTGCRRWKRPQSQRIWFPIFCCRVGLTHFKRTLRRLASRHWLIYYIFVLLSLWWPNRSTCCAVATNRFGRTKMEPFFTFFVVDVVDWIENTQ